MLQQVADVWVVTAQFIDEDFFADFRNVGLTAADSPRLTANCQKPGSKLFKHRIAFVYSTGMKQKSATGSIFRRRLGYRLTRGNANPGGHNVSRLAQSYRKWKLLLWLALTQSVSGERDPSPRSSRFFLVFRIDAPIQTTTNDVRGLWK